MVTLTERPTPSSTETGELWTIQTARDHARELVMHLHPGQARAWQSAARFTFMLAGTQGGKTSFGPLWLEREIARCGPGDYLAVTATFPLLKLKMLPAFLELFQDTLGYGTWHAADRVFEFSDQPTRVIFGSAHNAQSLESATAKAAWLDECGQDDFGIDAWRAIRRRLSLHRGRVLGGTTLYNLGWVKSEVYDAYVIGHPDYEVVQFDSIENPAFPIDEYRDAEAAMPDWQFKMAYRGIFDRPAGMVYSKYVDELRENGGHRIKPFPIPDAWPRVVGVDPGANATGKIFIARSPQGEWFAYREDVSGDLTTAEHAAAVKHALDGLPVQSIQVGAKAEKQLRRDWRAAATHIPEPAVSDVEAEIDRVNALFGKRQLFVFETLRGLRAELGACRRKVDDYGNVLSEIVDKSIYHRLDALRYAVRGVAVSRFRPV